MNAEIISSSMQLDVLVQEKLKTFWNSGSDFSLAELKTELKNLRYLIYIINQDRLVLFIQNLRQELMIKSSRASYSSQLEGQTDKEIMNKIMNNTDQLIYQREFYDRTENSSDICTVINTSILPNSYEPTEREFSPFSISPLISPRLPVVDNLLPTVFLTTEATFNKNRPVIEPKTPDLKSDEYNVSLSESSELNLSIFALNTSNYIPQHLGDEVLSPSCLGSQYHSRQSSTSTLYKNEN